jgi:hypothetical protein
MDMNAFQGTINQTSQKGREILKSLEDFKFTLEQTARLLTNNQELSQGMIQKRKSIDEISGKLYQIVFDIENTDISESFNNQNQSVMTDAPTNVPGQSPEEINPPGQAIPGQPPVPGGMPEPGGAPSGGPMGGGGGGGPMPGPGGAKPPEKDSEEGDSEDNVEDEEDTDSEE